jgi:Na+/melibiose symporter-like transporter
MFSMFLYLTLYLQNVLGYSPLETGLRFLPVTLLAFLVAPVAGRLSARVPARIFLGAGLVFVAAGLALMHGVSRDSTWMALLAGFVVAGIGIGLVNPPLASAAIGVVEPARSGMASGINSTFRQVGIATGIAGLGAVFQSRVTSFVIDGLAGTPAAGDAERIARGVASGGGRAVGEQVPEQARAAVGQVARDAFISGLNTLFVIAALTALVGAVLAAVLVRQRDFVATGEPAPAAV